MTLHIYRAKDQPATRYWVDLSTWKNGRITRNGFWVRCKRRALRYCHKCGKQRWAAYLTVHCYYDGTYYFCQKGKGCKA